MWPVIFLICFRNLDRKTEKAQQRNDTQQNTTLDLTTHALPGCISGMGQYREAQTLITESYHGLKAALGDAAQVVGESQYYLAMGSLLAADTEDAIAQTDPMLMQVGKDEHIATLEALPFPSSPFSPSPPPPCSAVATCHFESALLDCSHVTCLLISPLLGCKALPEPHEVLPFLCHAMPCCACCAVLCCGVLSGIFNQ